VKSLLAPLLAVSFMLGCHRDVSARDSGERYFSDPALSTSPFNVFSCATCHAVGAPAPLVVDGGPHVGAINPGYDLFNVVHRPSWWGGYITRLLDSMNYCLTEFMGGAALTAEDERARALFEYLNASSPDTAAAALPLTVVRNITSLSNLTGDQVRGRDVFARACQKCHGAAHSGTGRLSSRVSIIPEDTIALFPTNARAVVVEKVRHGKFFNIGGVMPLYSAEAITDQEIVDVLVYLGL
jgi:thiosulfate dehydrogenase